MSESEHPLVVATDARRVVKNLLDNIYAVIRGELSPANFLESCEATLIGLAGSGNQGIAAFDEALDDAEVAKRVFAAWILLGVDRSAVPIDARCTKRAGDTIQHTLREGSFTDRFLACALFATSGEMPKSCLPILKKSLTKDEPAIRVGAAAVLCANDQVNSESLSILNSALRCDNAILATMAASALGKVGVRQREAVRYLIEALAESGSPCQALALNAMQELGPEAIEAIPALSGIALDPAINPYVRAAALDAVASITRGTKAGHAVFMKALRDSQWQVVGAAAEGVLSSGDVPKKVVPLLTSHLSSADAELRRIAAVYLGELGSAVEEVLPALLARLEEESDFEAGRALAGALAAVGERVVEPLLERIVQRKVMNTEIVGFALGQLGERGAEAIGNVVLRHRDVVVRTSGIIMLREMGPLAAPAVPVLAEMLETADDEFAALLLSAIVTSGMAAKAAMPAVLRCVANRSDEVRWIARQVVASLGRQVLAEVEAALAASEGTARQHLEEVLEDISGHRPARFERCRDLNKDAWLVTYAAVGTALEQNGPMGFDAMEALLSSSGNEMEFRPTSVKSSTLRVTLNKLSAKLNQPVITQEHGRPSMLTDFGRDFLSETKAYLRSKTV
jgi:HEAT repeat protein